MSNAAAVATPKKAKDKAATIGDTNDDDEATPTKAVPKKRGKAVKIEHADAEGGDADTEVTPSAESPKKGRAKKSTAPLNTDANADATNETTATEVITLTPKRKRKRGPNKPKDPNATPKKRAKKGANAGSTDSAAEDNNTNNAANTELHGHETAAQTDGEVSIFGGDANVKKEDQEEEEGDDRLLDATEQKMVDDALFNIYTTGGQAA